MERPLIVFDVNETLLDLQHVTPILGRIFGDEGAMQLWFANLVLYSCALTLADHYVPFTDIGAAVLEMLAKTRGSEIAPADKKELTQAFSEMPPYAEVPDALDRLRANGFRLFTLTNNLVEVQTHQLTRGGIVDRFERASPRDGPRPPKAWRPRFGGTLQAQNASLAGRRDSATGRRPNPWRPEQFCEHPWPTLRGCESFLFYRCRHE